MASSMLTAEVSALASTEADVDAAMKTILHSCANDPDFAIICDFLQKFSKDLGFELPNFKMLLHWLTKTDEVSPQLRDIQIKLLRKTRKTVHEKSWESALSKFCFTYSAQDAWEIERFGYKNSSPKVKLRILRELLECQFERNTKFRAKILTLSADSLRSQPIGRDRLGHAYWVTQDNDCNIRIYQEHLDEEIWQVVATNRDEFVNLIKRLKGSEVVLPSTDIGIIDEDTTSSSSRLGSDGLQRPPHPEEKDDSLEDELKVPKLSIKLIPGSNTKETQKKEIGKGEEEIAAEEDAKLIKQSNNGHENIESGEEEFEEIDEEYDESEEDDVNTDDGNKCSRNKNANTASDQNKKVKPLLISQNKILKSENLSALMTPSKKRPIDELQENAPLENESEQTSSVKKSRLYLMDSKRTNSIIKKENNEDMGEENYEDTTNDEENDVEEEIEEEDIDSVAAEEDENEDKQFDDYDDDEDDDQENKVGEEITDPVVHVVGEGSGKDCDLGNYFVNIDFDSENYDKIELSEVIEEDVCYIWGEGSGKDCLVGNKNNDQSTSNEENSSKKCSDTKNGNDLDKSKPLNKNEDLDQESSQKCSSKQLDNDTNETKNSDNDIEIKANKRNCDIKKEEIECVKKQEKAKKEDNQLNGENNHQTTKMETKAENRTNSLVSQSNFQSLENKNKLLSEDTLLASSNENSNEKDKFVTKAEFDDTKVAIEQARAQKMLALESLKKELRESKQKLLEKSAQSSADSSSTKISNTAIFNRKRRLTDQQTLTTRPSNSESDVDLNSENIDDMQNDQELIDEDVGGKRIKMRPKQTNTELRKKIEAKKCAANDETTSSSSGEEELKRRKKIILSKQQTVESVIKPQETDTRLEKPKEAIQSKNKDTPTKNNDNNISSSNLELPQQAAIKKVVQNVSTKVKPTLAEIIEKKLKKAPEKSDKDLPGDTLSNLTITSIFSSPVKTPITKPLKKNLLNQIRKEESDEDAVPRKRTSSQDLSPTVLADIKKCSTKITLEPKSSLKAEIEIQRNTPESQRKRRSSEETIQRESLQEPETVLADTKKCTTKNTVKPNSSSKSEIEIQKANPERQRKRRSSEEAVQKESLEEPEAKKEVAVLENKDNATKQGSNSNPIKTENVDIESDKTAIKKEIKPEPTTPASGRRSGRRSLVAPSYVDNIQTKRNRGASKTSIKKENTKKEKVEIKEENKSKELKNNTEIAKFNVKAKNNKDQILDDKTNLKEKETNTISATKAKVLEANKNETISKTSTPTIKTPMKGTRQKREVDAINILDADTEIPVRQSRRIAQQKIREEAERRKLEEIALRTMKQELKKKKKAEKQADPTIIPPSESSSESEDSDVAIKKKVQKKKCPGKNGNWSSGSEEQEEPDEEEEEPPHYESDAGSPLFRSDHEFSPESDIEDESQVVPMKRARTVRKEDAGDDAINEEEACQKCHKSDHPEWILLCDNCDKGYHCSCLSPVLFYIPEGDWYCPPCQQEQLIKALENQLKEFDDLVENKRKQAEEEKRLAEEKALKEKEEELKKQNTKQDRTNAKKFKDNSDDEENSKKDRKTEESSENSDDSQSSRTMKQSSKSKDRSRSWCTKKNEKRNHRTRRHHNRRRDSKSHSEDSSKSTSESNSSSSSTYSDSDNEPIYKLRKRRQINVSYRLNEYDDLINSALKKEMDDAAGAGNLGRGKDISTIIEADKEEKARQKQLEEGDVITKPKESDQDKNEKEATMDNTIKTEVESKKQEAIEDVDSDAEPIIRKLKANSSLKKKSRKLTTLDISSEDDDGSDEDFKGSSLDEDEEDDTSISASNSDSSLDIYKRNGKFKKKRRKAARRAFRERRKDRRFIVDESDDEDIQRPKSKKKRKDDSDYTESEPDDDELSELSENIDSADLCDDTTTDDSDGAWRPNKRKKAKKSTTSFAQKSPKSKGSYTKKSKKIEYSDDDITESEEDETEEVGSGKGMGKQPRSQPLKSSNTSTKSKGKGNAAVKTKKKRKSSDDEISQSGSEDSTRRTRGRRYAYIEDFDDDSSEGGIKPGVQRPDTPPEEREKFIQRQEEIKRMLAEKNAEGAKLVATPRLTPIKTDSDKDKRSPAKTEGDSLSTVPLSVIRQAKVLDIDYLQRRGENLDDLSNDVGEVDDDFDDADLPDDLPEDMDEDAIARMVEEEEEFEVPAGREVPPADDVIRPPPSIIKQKVKEPEKPTLPANTISFPTSASQTVITSPSTSSVLQEPIRKRLPMPTMHPPLLRHQFLMHDSMANVQHHLMQRHAGPPTSHLLQNALSAPLTQPLERNYTPTQPSSSHHTLLNRMTHSIPLQSTVAHSLSGTRPSPINIAKPSPLAEPVTQEKPINTQPPAENKPRGRRKKITPLRDTLQKQQTAAAVAAAAATNSALAASMVKNNETVCSPIPSSVLKTGQPTKIPMQASVITSMPPSHTITNRPGVPITAVSGSTYPRTDGPRYYNSPGNRILQGGIHRHRGPPQLPPSLLPPHPANRPTYGPPPPLKGSNSAPAITSTPNASGSIRNPVHHVPPYLGVPPNARHSSHLNIYRPPMYGNPNFGPRINLRAPNPNIHPSEFSPGSRTYSPYGFYPPPPPLTTPGQRPVLGPRPTTQLPPVQTSLPQQTSSVIVSAATVTKPLSAPPPRQPRPAPPPPEIPEKFSKPALSDTTELPVKVNPSKSSPTHAALQTDKQQTVVEESRKKLTTLQAYTTDALKKSPLHLVTETSGSQNSPRPSSADDIDDSSTPGISENTSSTEQTGSAVGKASEFSGLVSYFSSQHDDYNT